MNIILVITNTRGKNLVFISDKGEPLQLKSAIIAAKHGTIKGIYIVRRGTGTYLRTKPYIPEDRELETLSITSRKLISYAQDARHVQGILSLNNYIKFYASSFVEGQAYLLPIGQPKTLRVLTATVKARFVVHKKYVLSAAREFFIDPTMLGAILIDEIARLSPFENIIDALGGDIIGWNVSIGVAQIKIDTAHDLIRKGIYHPDPRDARLPYNRLTNAGRRHLYDYLIQPKHNVRFAAAFIRFVIDFWAPYIDISTRTDIIGTLYHQGYGKPKMNPKADERGKQIAHEFYQSAKRWMR